MALPTLSTNHGHRAALSTDRSGLYSAQFTADSCSIKK